MRAYARRRVTEMEPKPVDCLGEREPFRYRDGLDHIVVGAEFVGTFNIEGEGRGREDDHRDIPQVPLVLHPMQHIKAGRARHFDVEQHETRQRVAAPVRDRAFTGELLDRGLAVLDGLQRVGDTNFRERVLDEKHIVRVVFGIENAIATHVTISSK